MPPDTGETPAIEVPPLPAGATPEERDRHWFKYVYRGDRIPQLTVRAVVMGGLLGMFMSISNLYTILKLGFSFGVAIVNSFRRAASLYCRVNTSILCLINTSQ